MLKKINYSGINAKTKAMKARHLSDASFDELCGKSSVSDAASYLKDNTGYSDIFSSINVKTIHRNEIEELLSMHYRNEVKKIYLFISGQKRKVLEHIFIKYEIECIKDKLRRLKAREESHSYLHPGDFFEDHMTIDLDALYKATTASEVNSCIKGSKYEKIVTPLLNPHTGTHEQPNAHTGESSFTIEMKLDLYYFNYLLGIKKYIKDKNDKKIFSDLFGAVIDVTNIMWIYRCKKYFNISKELIYTYLIPYRQKLKKNDITDFVEAENPDDFIRIVSGTIYKDLFTDLEERFIEQNFKHYIYGVSRKVLKNNPFSIAAILIPVHMAEIEINNINTVVECIRYGLSKDQIKEIVG